MNKVTFVRSSSLNQWDYCQHSHFLTYTLGYQQDTNVKTEQGSAVHKVMEILANLKLFKQNNPDLDYVECTDEALGHVRYSLEEMREKTELTCAEVDAINKTRINKSVYMYDVQLPYGTIRWGVGPVTDLINRSSKYYSERSCGTWQRMDFKHVNNFTWIVLEHSGGEFDPRRNDIVSPEMNFVLPLEKPWAKLENGSHFAIKGTIDLIRRIDDKTYEIVDYKGLPLDTKIPTPTGWTTMGDIQVGDVVYDMNGKKTKVTGKSHVKFLPCYKITFDDTSTVICDEEHRWKLIDGSVCTVTDLIDREVTRIPIAAPIDCDEVDLPIDPYILGIWLGDGRNRNGEISSMDQFVWDEIQRRGFTIGPNISSRPDKPCEQRTVYELSPKLRELNLLHNKHIPSIYLRASYAQRLDLLRGLMDSDGSVNTKRKQCVFTNCHKPLSMDVKELLLSLGQRPLLSDVKTVCKSHDYDYEGKGYPISFRAINIDPFLLPIKSGRLQSSWGAGQSGSRLIKKIEKIDTVATQCIMVDSDTHTFLCTENFIPTHNTGRRLDWGTNTVKDYDYLCQDKQLMLYYYAASQLFPDKNIILTIFFIRDGGPFTICFDRDDLPKIEEKIKRYFFETNHTPLPRLRDPSYTDFQCKTLCHFYKNKLPGTNDHICKFIHDQIKATDIDTVVEKYTREGHVIGHYEAPG